MRVKCMDCGREFAGAPGDRRCDGCTVRQTEALQRLPKDEQDRLIAEALERAVMAGE